MRRTNNIFMPQFKFIALSELLVLGHFFCDVSFWEDNFRAFRDSKSNKTRELSKETGNIPIVVAMVLAKVPICLAMYSSKLCRKSLYGRNQSSYRTAHLWT